MQDIKKDPDMVFVKQKLFKSVMCDIAGVLQKAFSSLSIDKNIKPYETVAVAVGSRGINCIDKVVYNCIQYLKAKSLKPFIVPAMGSHGGGTSKGQIEVLANLGITKSLMNVPVCSNMDTVCIGKLTCGTEIFFSKEALKADHIVVVNRVKPHTKFKASVESGLSKMLSVGLGKAKGAAEIHRSAVDKSFKIIEHAANYIIGKKQILFGLALLEDGYGNLAHVEVCMPESIVGMDKTLLKKAYSMMANIPFDMIDILIVDNIGKDISGIGMDSNVIGRHRDITGDFYTYPNVKRIFVRDLSPGSDGNGNGIGLADVTTKRLVDSIDFKKTYLNAITAVSPEKAAIPMYFENDKKALEVCVQTIGITDIKNVRMVRIKDTASLEYLQVSKAFEPEISANSHIEQVTSFEPFKYDQNGNLADIKYLLP